MKNHGENGMISRRSFLGGAFGLAVVGGMGGGCASVPFFGSLRKDASLVALLSDCHVGNWNSPSYQGVKFSECIARVLALDPLPARMIIPGDLAYLWGRREDYALAKKLLQPVVDAGIEVTIGMGNHDRRENFLEFWPEYADRTLVPGKIVSKVRGLHFDYIMLDTLDQPVATDRWITPGVLDDNQRDWLRAECAAATRPLIVMAHHPAIELGVPGKSGPKSALDFGEVILGKKSAPTKCCGFIHGHDHYWYVTRSLKPWYESRVGRTASLPSTGHWGDIGYALLRESPDRAVVSLVQYDYFSPQPLNADEKPRSDWKAVVEDNANASCTFVV